MFEARGSIATLVRKLFSPENGAARLVPRRQIIGHELPRLGAQVLNRHLILGHGAQIVHVVPAAGGDAVT